MSTFLNFPEVLRNKKQWVMWRYEVRNGKKTKVPYKTNGSSAASTRPETWGTFEECVAFVGEYDGIGYVFAGEEVGIDLDHCFQADGTLTPFAEDTLARFPSYTEKSPSGEGLHIVILSDVGVDGRKLDHVECYSSGRYFTVTGDVFRERSALTDCDVLEWYQETFPKVEEKEIPVQTSMIKLPKDEDILRIMFGSKNGIKVQKLFLTGDWAAAGHESQSQADMSLASTLLFWCANDIVAADRLFRQSKLYRPKWDELRGPETYGAQTLRKSRCSEVMKWRQVEYIMSGGEHPTVLLILENICRFIESDDVLRSRFRLNDFSHMIEFARGADWDTLQEYDILETQRYISTNNVCFARVSKEMTLDAIRITASLNKVNPPRDYLTGLVWDQVPRIEFWLHNVYGVPNDELHQAIGSNWLKGLVKRVMSPGCQFDEVLVLEGPQGYRKSSSLRVLGAPWHVESTLSTEDRDFYMLLARSIIVEFSEGEIIGRTSARKLKAIITKTEDSYRPPYERGMMTFKRGCVFAMTTNDGDYQKDETGGRRWLPVVLRKIADVDYLSENRDQLYAEAYYRVQELKETTHEYPQEELRELQGTKLETDEITERIVRWYEKQPDDVVEKGILTIDAYNGVLNDKENDVNEIQQEKTWRIAKVFRTALGLENRAKRVGGRLVKRWFKVGSGE